MTQLTLRGFDRELERALRRVAREERISLNQAALKLLRKGAGVEAAAHAAIGEALDPFVGSMSLEDAHAVADSVRLSDEADLAQQRQRGKPR